MNGYHNMQPFTAYRINNQGGSYCADFESITLESLALGDVVIKAVYSGINYKDALAATGAGQILKKFPLVGGIDVSGYVETSEDRRFKPGDAVAVCGCGLSENRDGGYAEYVRVPADCVVPLPRPISLFQAMAIGSAGFTAAMAVDRMQLNGQSVGLGPIVITGASGGVGSIAIDLFSSLGFEVVALTRKADAIPYLESLGASKVILRHELTLGDRPLDKAQWGGAVDNVGGELLSWLTRTVKPRGNISAIGLAGGTEINTTVMPFILRGVSLLGINSVNCPSSLREHIWQRLATDLHPQNINAIVTGQIPLRELPDQFDRYLKGDNIGRTVVKISEESTST